jgi:hypothetical protein
MEQAFGGEIALDQAIRLFRENIDLGAARRWENGEAKVEPSGLPGHVFWSFRDNAAGIALVHRHHAIDLGTRVVILTGTCARASRSEVEPLFSRAVASLTKNAEE